MQYKRITKKNRNGTIEIDFYGLPKKENQMLLYITAMSRLVELEDKIENGTLVEFPCKVGDAVREIIVRIMEYIFQVSPQRFSDAPQSVRVLVDKIKNLAKEYGIELEKE